MSSDESTALLLAGALGGPFTIALYTPLRNAITLGAHDPSASASSLYRRTVSHGYIRGGFAGWAAPTFFSSAQFVAMGPLYHKYASLCGPDLAVIPTALTESTITYGSQTRNAQIAHNLNVANMPEKAVRLQAPWDPRGAGFAPHVLRNACAMSGIRVLSPPIRKAMGAEGNVALSFAADFSATILSAAISMPFNQLFNFLTTTHSTHIAEAGILSSCARFLRTQYLTPAGRFSATVLRDAFMRVAYIAPQLSTYSAIERFATARARRE